MPTIAESELPKLELSAVVNRNSINSVKFFSLILGIRPLQRSGFFKAHSSGRLNQRVGILVKKVGVAMLEIDFPFISHKHM